VQAGVELVRRAGTIFFYYINYPFYFISVIV
jgi:hypothetical protein